MRYTSVREQLKNLVSLIRDATFPKFAETRSDVRVYIKDVLSDLLRNVHSVDEIKVVDFRVEDRIVSDHKGLIAEIE